MWKILITRTSVFLFSETNNDDNNNYDNNVWLLKYVKIRYYNAYYFLFIIILKYKNILLHAMNFNWKNMLSETKITCIKGCINR